MKKRNVLAIAVVLMTAVSLFAQGGAEQSTGKYPSGDVNFIIPSGAGGGNDLLTRAMIPSLQKTWGVNVIPLNQTESKGAVAAQNVMNAQPDGRTFYFNSQTLILMPYGGMPSIDLSQFQAVAQAVEDTGVIYVKADSPYKNIDDFLSAARKGGLKVGHNGKGALWQLAAAQLDKAINGNFKYVAYTSGGTQMLTALAGGEIDFCIVNAAEGKGMVDSGLVRPLASLGENRLDTWDIPTVKESGVDFVFPVWRGVFTKAGISEELLTEIDKAFKTAIESPEFVDFCNKNSLPIKYRDHNEFQKFVEEQIVIYDELMKQ